MKTDWAMQSTRSERNLLSPALPLPMLLLPTFNFRLKKVSTVIYSATSLFAKQITIKMCIPLCAPTPYVEFHLKDPPKDKKDKKKKKEEDRYITLYEGAGFYKESGLLHFPDTSFNLHSATFFTLTPSIQHFTILRVEFRNHGATIHLSSLF